MNIETATASASELARINPDGQSTPNEDIPKPMKMPRSFSIEDTNDACTIQRVVSALLLLFLVYAVVMSTYAVIAVNNQNYQTCSCSTEDVESALFVLGKLPTPTTSPTYHPSSVPTYNPSFIPSDNPSTPYPTAVPSSAPTVEPTLEPTIIPTMEPTTEPTFEPTMEPTKVPTMEPTMEPTLQPIDHFDGYFVGDFKLSLKRSDHGFWRLCDGKSYRIDGEYSLLFEEIGFMFGAYNDTIANVTYFHLPNVSDSAVGIAGSNHLIGEQIGDEGVVLEHNNIPAHTHPTIRWASSSDGTSNYNDRSICQTGHNGAYNLNHCALANGWATGYPWQGYGSNPVSVMQPTTFISNLFIYTGVYL